MSTTIADVTVDVCLSVEHSYENDVTSHPVEKGSELTDNVIAKPLLISLDCIVSGSPIGAQTNSAFGPNIVNGVRARLITLRGAGETITVVDSHGTFPNMVIEKITFSKSVKTGDSLAFKISFKEILIVTNERTVIQVAIPRAQAPVSRGAKSSKSPPDPPVPAKVDDRLTPLHRLTNRAGITNSGPNTGF